MKIALFSKSWPRHNYNSQLEFSISLIESLINLSHNVTVCSEEPNIQIKQEVKDYPMQLIDINSKKVGYSLNALAKSKNKPNLFILDGFESEQMYSAFLYNRWNKSPRILAINQLPKLSKWRKNSYKLMPNVLIPQSAPMSPEKIQDILSVEELRSIHRSDYIVTGNQYIYYLLNKHVFSGKQKIGGNFRNLAFIRNGLPLDEFAKQVYKLEYRPFENRKNFVYFGNFDKESTVDTVFALVNFIWPGIKKQISDAELHIFGSFGGDGKIGTERLINMMNNNNKTYTKQILNKMGIFVKGYLQNPQDLSQYRLLLNPTIFSAGLHFKQIESWFCHLPVVTTPVGAEGIFLQSLDPQFATPLDGNTNVLASQRVFSSIQKQNSDKINNYYSRNQFIKTEGSFTFGGSYQNFTYRDFIQNAIQLYKNQKQWNNCLTKAHKIIKTNHHQKHMQTIIKRSLVNVQVSTYQGRSKQNYEEEWKRYSRSLQFSKKVRI